MSSVKKDKAESQTPQGSVVGSTNGQSETFEVGYGQPPMHTRFKPGESGNPRGRPAGRPNAKTTVARVINETVPVHEGERTRKMTKLEAMLQAHTLKAMKGDSRSASIVIGLLMRMGLFADPEGEAIAAVPEQDIAIVNNFIRRNARLFQQYKDETVKL